VSNDGPTSDPRGVEIPSPRNLGEEQRLRKLGAWKLDDELARAPGVLLYAARQGDRRCLLQVVPLRPVGRPDDRKRMSAAVRTIEAETRRHQEREPDLQLIEHGVLETQGGSYVVYWALPWTSAAERLDPRGGFIGSADELVIVLHDLLERIAQRDARGLRDPLLCEHLIACDPKLGSTVAGMPLVVDPRWTDDDLASPRLLDEERGPDGPQPTARGDLHRLGVAMEAFGHVLGGLPDPLLALFRRFRADYGDGEGFSSASEALRELEALDDRGELGVRPKSLSAPRIASAQTVVMTRQRSESPEGQAVTEDDLESPSQDATVAMEPVTAPGRDGEPTVRAMPSEATVVDPKPGPRSEPGAPAGSEPDDPGPSAIPESHGTVVGVRLPGPEYLARPSPGGGAGGPGQPPSPNHGRVVPGPALPGSPPPDAGGSAASPWGPPAPGAGSPSGHRAPEAPEENLELQVSGRTKLMMAIGLLVVGVFAFVGVEVLAPDERSAEMMARRNVLQRMPAENDVELAVQPSSATIISERDGQILGRGLVRMMVGDDPPVLLAHAPGHYPARIVLPHRGRMLIGLTKIAGDSEACLTRITVPPGVKLETMEGTRVDPDTVSFDVATVLRDGSGQGAWFIRCPPKERERKVVLPNRPPPQRVELEVEWPSGARVSVDGESQGTAPLSRTVRSGFVKVEAETDAGTVRRWIPAFTDTAVELPAPLPEPRTNEAPADEG